MRTYIAGSMLTMLAVSFVIAGGAIPRKEDMPKYIKTISSTSASAKDKTTAANAIAKRGEINIKDVEGALEPLKNLAQTDKDDSVRKAAVHAIGALAAEPEETVPVLIKVLKNDKSQGVKFETVNALARFGPKAKSALPAINDFNGTLEKKDKRMIKAATDQIRGTTK